MSDETGMTLTQHEPGLPSGGQLSSGRIDVHAHYVPPGLQASVPPAPIFRGFATWGPEAALEMMDRQGIATAILSMVLWTGMFTAPGDAAAARRVARSSNEAAAEIIRSYPGRFGGFACLPLPDVDAALAEIDYGLGTLRLAGVVLLTNYEASISATAGLIRCSTSSTGVRPWCSSIRRCLPASSTPRLAMLRR
jgi:predicted TIM-barrel fold metal-dependent hydrolase